MAELPPLLMWLALGVRPYWLSLTSLLHCSEIAYMTWYYFYSCFYYYFSRLRSYRIFYLHFFIRSFFQHPLGSGYEQHCLAYKVYISLKMVFHVVVSSFSIFLILVWIPSVNYLSLSLLFLTYWCIFYLKISAIYVLWILFYFSVIWSFFILHFFFSASKVSNFSTYGPNSYFKRTI